MVEELIHQLADSFARERSEDTRLEICLTVFGREHLMLESFSVRLAKALAVPHASDDNSPAGEYREVTALKDRGWARINGPRRAAKV